MIKVLLWAAAALVLIVAALVVVGRVRWSSSTRELVGRLESARATGSDSTYSPDRLAGLPEAVRRYFETVLSPGQPLVTAARVTHTGTFNLSETEEKWVPFTSQQRVVTRRPGFVWEARIRMAPGLSVFVHDAYVAGEGILEGRLLGLIPVVREPSTPQLAQGELMRFFAEATWYPTALLPGGGVAWEPLDETRARATLVDGGVTVEFEVGFDDDGLITSVRSEGRFRATPDGPVATPWEGRFWDYQRRNGMLVPLEGEVAWLLPDRRVPYWRGRIQEVEYEFGG